MYRMDDNPPPRFPERPVCEAEHPWWVLKLRSRMEKATARDCLERGIEYYLPMYTKVVRRRDNGRNRKTILPLFPGYLPISCPSPHSLLNEGRVVYVMPVKNQSRFARELSQVYAAWDGGVEIAPCPTELLAVGSHVRIVAGSLKGLRGQVHSRHLGCHTLVLEVGELGRVAVRLDASIVAEEEAMVCT